MKKLKYLNKDFSDLEFEDFPLKVQESLMKLGIAVLLFRGTLIILAILIIAMLLWFNKLTIFFTTVQVIFCFVLFQIRRSEYKKAKKLISQE